MLGPGTADPHVVPADQRAAISRGANLVVVGGVVRGTWSQSGDEVQVTWFDAAPARAAIEGEVERLATILDTPLRLAADPR